MFQLEKFFGGLVKGSDKKDKKTGKPVKHFLSDSLKVSLVIAALVVVVIFLIFKDAIGQDENFFGLMLKAGLFTVIIILSGVFMHSKHLEHVYEDKYSNKSANEAVDRSTASDDDDISLSDLSPAKQGGTSSASDRDSTGNIDVHVSISGKHNSDDTPKSGAFETPEDIRIR